MLSILVYQVSWPLSDCRFRYTSIDTTALIHQAKSESDQLINFIFNMNIYMFNTNKLKNELFICCININKPNKCNSGASITKEGADPSYPFVLVFSDVGCCLLYRIKRELGKKI